MLNAVSQDDMTAIIEAMKKKAIGGSESAAKLVMSYCVGKPVAPVNPDTLDQDELKTIIGNHLESAEGPLNVLKGMPLDVLVEIFRLTLPILRAEKVKMAKKVLCAPLTEEEIEDAKDDEDDEVSDDSAAAAPAGDPFENIPEWMRNIGKETEQTPGDSAQPTRRASRRKPDVSKQASGKKAAGSKPARTRPGAATQRGGGGRRSAARAAGAGPQLDGHEAAVSKRQFSGKRQARSRTAGPAGGIAENVEWPQAAVSKRRQRQEMRWAAW